VFSPTEWQNPSVQFSKGPHKFALSQGLVQTLRGPHTSVFKQSRSELQIRSKDASNGMQEPMKQ
jgi:hypothetical protein